MGLSTICSLSIARTERYVEKQLEGHGYKTHNICSTSTINPSDHNYDEQLQCDCFLIEIRQRAICAMTTNVATPRSNTSLRVGLFHCTTANSPNHTMQSSPSIPRLPQCSDSSIVINATQWNQDTLREVIISFTKLEQAADSMFKKIEEQVQNTSSHIRSLEDACFIELSHP